MAKSLLDQVRDGDRKVCVSFYHFGRESSWSELSFDEAAEALAESPSARVSPWQFYDPDEPENSFSRQEEDELRSALSREARRLRRQAARHD